MPAGYNNCFTLCENDKKPRYQDQYGVLWPLHGGVKGILKDHYRLTYRKARTELEAYKLWGEPQLGSETLRVSLYLANAMYGDLHIFIMDFDDHDTTTPFFKEASQAADFVTVSKSGGHHMYFGVNKEKAKPLFDSLNLLTAKAIAGLEGGWIDKTGCVTLDGKNKVDFFCDTRRVIYEWEEWDESRALTDKTEAVYELIKANFDLNRPKEITIDFFTDAEWHDMILEGYTEKELRGRMTDNQRAVFDDLVENISSDVPKSEWIKVGFDIFAAFGGNDDNFDCENAALGGSVFLYWSKLAPERFQPQSCANAWNYICSQGDKGKVRLHNHDWEWLLNQTPNAFDLVTVEKERSEP